MMTVAEAPKNDQHDELRAEVKRIMAEEKLSQADVSRLSGIAYQTLSAWLNDKYAGNVDRVATEVQKWLNARASQRQTASVIATSPIFQTTPTAEEFLAALQYAQVAQDLTVLVGAPGIGKTSAMEQYRDENPHVWIATMEPVTSRPTAMLQEICSVLEVTERGLSQLSRAIGNFLRGKGGLLCIDEGQHLSTEALDQLRTLNDRYKVGIVVAGNEKIIAKLEGAKGENGQLHSRVGVRINRPASRPGDINMLIDAWGVTDEEERRLLTTVASRPGALRALDKCMRLATTLANGGNEPRTSRHILAAYDRLTPQTLKGV